MYIVLGGPKPQFPLQETSVCKFLIPDLYHSSDIQGNELRPMALLKNMVPYWDSTFLGFLHPSLPVPVPTPLKF